jgi:uncharacterized membrane protein YsdA (DUF1294 family)
MDMVPGSPQFLAVLLVMYLVFVNLLTLILFRVDALRAEADESRVSESLLLIFATLGGSVAAKLAERKLATVTRTATFCPTLSLVVMSQLAAGMILNTDKGQTMVIDLGSSAVQMVASLATPTVAGQNG